MSEVTLTALLPSLDPVLVLIICGIFLLAGIVKGSLASACRQRQWRFSPADPADRGDIAVVAANPVHQHLPVWTRAGPARIVTDYVWFAIPLAASIFITSLFIVEYPTTLLTIAIGGAMVIFAVNLLFGLTVPIGPGPVWQGAFGILSGVLGGLSSIWSPPVAMYLIARDTPKERFIGAAGFLFLAGCIPLGVGLVMAGLITWAVIVKSSLGLVATLIGFRIGEIMRTRVSQDRFRQIVLIGFLIMGTRLIAIGLF